MKNLLKNFSVRAGSSFAVISNLFKKTTRKKDGKQGWYFNRATWGFIFRPVASLIGGAVVALIIQLAISTGLYLLSITGNPISFFEAFLITALFSVLFAAEDSTDDIFTVPPTKFASEMSWLGIALPIYLESSEYTWLGKKLGFRVIRNVAEPFTDELGYLRMGEVQFRVWNDANAKKGSVERTFVTAPARNSAEIRTTLTLIFEIVNPRLCLDSASPAIDFGDRARQEFRELVTKFVDTDVPKLHSVLGDLYKGRGLVTCFIGKAISGHKVGSMVRSRTGEPMFELVKEDETKEEAYKRLKEAMTKLGDKEMLREVKDKDSRGDYLWEEVKVSDSIEDFLPSIGCRLIRVSFADIDFSDKVKAAAEQASAEQGERLSQLASADTIVEVRNKLLPTEKETSNPGYQLATVIAAAQDDKNGNIQIVMVPGGDNIVQAAVAGALQINKGGKK